MGVDAVRHVTSAELAAFRARRMPYQWGGASARPGSAVPDGVDVHEAEQGPGNSFYVSAPKRVGVKREAREVRDAVTDRRLASILARKNDPEFVQRLARAYREKYPGLGSRMTDDEIVKVSVEQASKLATERAFKKIGRGVHNGNT